MSENTKIQWTDHTFNIAWGCTKVSDGCRNCYADRDATRYGFKIWGKDAERRTFGEKHWNEPLKWNRAAKKAGVRARVFCSSMCDVFEDHPTIDAERAKLWPLIEATPWLDWQVLTKRADRMRALAPKSRISNVWFGVSVEDGATAAERIPKLLATPATVRFVSYEPALGPVDFAGADGGDDWLGDAHDDAPGERGIDWIIVGGESGPGARPCSVPWIRSAVAQCKAAGVPVFVKQIGARPCAQSIDDMSDEDARAWDIEHGNEPFPSGGVTLPLRDRKGGDPSEWPEDLRVREFPHRNLP